MKCLRFRGERKQASCLTAKEIFESGVSCGHVRHSRTTLTPHWRNLSALADESESECGVVG
jgi:hypothetical protein